jgi:hypothetical protein
VVGGLRFAQIAAGGDDTCGITPSGRLYCWGGYPGDLPGSLMPVPVGGAVRFSAVSVGAVICAIGTDSRTYCWGQNAYAQLGTPMESAGPGLGEAQPVVGAHLYATVHVPIGYPLPADLVPVTNGTACGTTSAGALYCWGPDADTARFEIGDVGLQGCPVGRPITPCTYVPLKMHGPDLWARRAAVGFPCAVTTTGGLSCWGTVFQGWGSAPTGRTDSWDVLAKERDPIPLLLPTPVRDIVGAATLSGACAHAVDGRVVCWGKSVSGQFGSGVASDSLGIPTIVAGGRAFTRLSGGYLFMCGLTGAGEILCWGDASRGVLGLGPNVPPSANGQRPVPTPTRIASIAGK